MESRRRKGLAPVELAGFGVIVTVFVALLLLLDVEGQSWGAFGLLAVFLGVLVGYRTWLGRRRSA